MSVMDAMMYQFWIKNIAILNVTSNDYRCALRNLTRYGAIKRLNDSKLNDNGSL